MILRLSAAQTLYFSNMTHRLYDLSQMSREQLEEIAKGLGIKFTKKTDNENLAYAILDAEAKLASTQPDPEKPAPKKRGRKPKALKETAEEAGKPAKTENPAKPEQAAKAEEPKAAEPAPAPAPKKRGRKSNAQKEAEARAAAEKAAAAQAPKAEEPAAKPAGEPTPDQKKAAILAKAQERLERKKEGAAAQNGGQPKPQSHNQNQNQNQNQSQKAKVPEYEGTVEAKQRKIDEVLWEFKRMEMEKEDPTCKEYGPFSPFDETFATDITLADARIDVIEEVLDMLLRVLL